VPFDPPWLDSIDIPVAGAETPQEPSDQNGEQNADQESIPPAQPLPDYDGVAPSRRFANSRRAIGDFARTGRRAAFRKAAGHYSRTGMGGAHNVANRLRISTATGANVFGLLQSSRNGTDPVINSWVASLTSRNATAYEIADEIIRRAVPMGGSQDEASCQESMAQAIQDLIAYDENVDLLHLNDDGIWMLIESFISYEAFSRMYLDIGQVFENSTLNARERTQRMNEMQTYLKADLAAQVERLRENTPHATSDQLQTILKQAVENTFAVYEGVI
jgi:hypothetical protein